MYKKPYKIHFTHLHNETKKQQESPQVLAAIAVSRQTMN